MYYDEVGFEVLGNDHYYDLQKEAEHQHLIRLVQISGKKKRSIYSRLLANLGAQMVVWGNRLLTRYEDLTLMDQVNLPESNSIC